MATETLQELRDEYKAAYSEYVTWVQALSGASQAGVLPSDEVLGREAEALQDLNSAREALLAELYAHVTKER